MAFSWSTTPGADNRNYSPYLTGISILLALGLMVFFVSLFELRWETNDDVGMSMVIHGYGYMTQASPFLVFSNVIWGHFIQMLPDFFIIPGYSLATILVLWTVTTVLLYGLYQLGVGYLPGFFMVLLVMAQAVITPQFTINAGLLTVAAVTSLLVHVKNERLIDLFIACLLAFCAYLIRANEFILVAAVSIPLIPWTVILRKRSVQIAAFLLAIACASAAIIDKGAYNNPIWETFNEFQETRVPFNDYGAVQYLKERPDIIAKYGYTNNDLDLIEHWFFADPNIANSKKLQSMLAELGPLSLQSDNVDKGWLGLTALGSTDRILPLMVIALIFAFLFPRRQVAIAFVLFFAAMFALGFMGRPGILRVYYPLVCLLVLAPFLLYKNAWSKHNQSIAALLLLIACIVNFKMINEEQVQRKTDMQQFAQDVKGLPNEILVRWGALFPTELVYPVLDTQQSGWNLKFYNLGTRTLMPMTYAAIQENAGEGLINTLLSDKGILIIGVPGHPFPQKLLARYCLEHHQRQMQTINEYRSPTVVVERAKCIQ